jgi:hypothetical protein
MGITVEQISAGDGKTFPKKGDKLKMHYTGTLKVCSMLSVLCLTLCFLRLSLLSSPLSSLIIR